MIINTLSSEQTAQKLGVSKNYLLKLLRDAGVLQSTGALKNTPAPAYFGKGLFFSHLTHFKRGPRRVSHVVVRFSGEGLKLAEKLLIETQTQQRRSA